MSSRFQRPSQRGPVAPVHRGPQALPPGASSAPAPQYGYPGFNLHAPNAALLIDFDNVTMGIQKDMQTELRNLLSSDIIKGKVSVQRAYADWRRYPAYIVPLTEASIDLIFAPAYGSAKKNATDIRLAIDAMELVFTRPEIGTYILLSGDSDFSSLVIKLKEYGKYVIGVGIRESSSDLLVQNCDEYYSYNALAGLVRAGDEEIVRWDPWELVTEALQRMVRNGDTMRADRLKQVMQDVDPSFDEKDHGMSKFSSFVREAERRGLVTITRLENGQFEIGIPAARPAAAPAAAGAPAAAPERAPRDGADVREGERERGRERDRSRRGRGRGRGREFDRPPRGADGAEGGVGTVAPDEAEGALHVPAAVPQPDAAPPAAARPVVGTTGERLTRAEAHDLVRRAVESLTQEEDESVSARAVRERAFELLGRDSESLAERMFERILRDAHEANLVDLRRRGDDYELSRAVRAESVADQLNRAAAAQTAAAPPPPPTPVAPRGMGHRGLARGGKGGALGAPPPELLAIGVVQVAGSPAASSTPVTTAASAAPATLETSTGAPQRAAAASEPPAPATEPAAAGAASPPADSEPLAGAEPSAGGADRAGGRGRGRRGRGGRGGGAAAGGEPRSAEDAPAAAAPAAVAPAPVTPAAPPAAEGVAAPGGARPAARGGRGRGAPAAKGGATKTATKTAAKTATKTAPPAAKQPTPAAAKQGAGRPGAAKGGAAKQGAAKQAGGTPRPPAPAPAAAPAGNGAAAAGAGRGRRGGGRKSATKRAE